MPDAPQILDMCCGSRMFWFDKQDERAVFCDIRNEQHTLCDGRHLIISPDIIADFRNLPFPDESFSVVVFDPPHLERVGPNGWQGKKYGKLDRDTWRDDLRAGFAEGFRVLRQGGGIHFQMERNPDPRQPGSGAHGRKTGHLATHRQKRQNPLDYIC